MLLVHVVIAVIRSTLNFWCYCVLFCVVSTTVNHSQDGAGDSSLILYLFIIFYFFILFFILIIITCKCAIHSIQPTSDVHYESLVINHYFCVVK